MAQVGKRVRVEVTYHGAAGQLRQYRREGVLVRYRLPDEDYHGATFVFEGGVMFAAENVVDAELIPLEGA